MIGRHTLWLIWTVLHQIMTLQRLQYLSDVIIRLLSYDIAKINTWPFDFSKNDALAKRREIHRLHCSWQLYINIILVWKLRLQQNVLAVQMIYLFIVHISLLSLSIFIAQGSLLKQSFLKNKLWWATPLWQKERKEVMWRSDFYATSWRRLCVCVHINEMFMWEMKWYSTDALYEIFVCFAS